MLKRRSRGRRGKGRRLLIEHAIQDRLWEESEENQIEVNTGVGRIDLLTPKTVMEIKKARLWQQGLGQLIAYSYFYREHKKVLRLFDKRISRGARRRLRPSAKGQV